LIVKIGSVKNLDEREMKRKIPPHPYLLPSGEKDEIPLLQRGKLLLPFVKEGRGWILEKKN